MTYEWEETLNESHIRTLEMVIVCEKCASPSTEWEMALKAMKSFQPQNIALIFCCDPSFHL